MDDDGGFLRWFVPWKGLRPDDTPIGWYSIDDLAAAFTAGKAAEFQRGLEEIQARTDALAQAISTWRDKQGTDEGNRL